MAYKRERHLWEIEIQERYALDIYKRIWPNCEIKEIDKEGIDDEFKKELDFSGIDKIIKINRINKLHLAQRFRKPRKNDLPIDFSFRYKTLGLEGTIQNAEYFMLLEAFKNNYYYPQKYAFGVTKGDNLYCGGFKSFYIFDLSPLLEAIINDEIHYIGIYRNYENGEFDGSCGIYYKIEDLKDFIFYEWHESTSIFNYRNSTQVKLSLYI